MDLSSTSSCSPSPTHLCTCLFPFLPLFPYHHGFFFPPYQNLLILCITISLLNFVLHSSLKSNANMFGVQQPDSIRHGSLRATAASSIHLLLHNSHHYGKQHLAFIQLHSLHSFSTPPIMLTSLFVHCFTQLCFTSEHLYHCIGNPWTNEDISSPILLETEICQIKRYITLIYIHC